MSEDEMSERRAAGCGTCGGTGLMLCTHAGTGRDADGWCTACDQPADVPDTTTCATCQ